jgi:hypothetical protein
LIVDLGEDAGVAGRNSGAVLYGYAAGDRVGLGLIDRLREIPQGDDRGIAVDIRDCGAAEQTDNLFIVDPGKQADLAG